MYNVRIVFFLISALWWVETISFKKKKTAKCYGNWYIAVVNADANVLSPYILCPKNVTTLSRYNYDIRESILIIVGTNVTDGWSTQSDTLFSLPSTGNYSAAALPDEMKGDKNSILSLKCSTVALPDFNQSLAKFIQSCSGHRVLVAHTSHQQSQSMCKHTVLLSWVLIVVDVSC